MNTMARITRPLFGDTATGTIAGLITFRNIAGTQSAGKAGQQTSGRSAAQRHNNERYAQAHAQWMLLPTHHVKVKYRWYWKRTPDWPTYFRTWLQEHP